MLKITLEIERDTPLSIADALIEYEKARAVSDVMMIAAKERIHQTGMALLEYVDSCERINEWIERNSE